MYFCGVNFEHKTLIFKEKNCVIHNLVIKEMLWSIVSENFHKKYNKWTLKQILLAAFLKQFKQQKTKIYHISTANGLKSFWSNGPTKYLCK